MAKLLSEMTVAELKAEATKRGLTFSSKANKAALLALLQPVTPPYAGEVGAQSEVSTLHLHPDANNFGAAHDESEARKLQKRADNGYTGQ